jgi:hypothetical protein
VIEYLFNYLMSFEAYLPSLVGGGGSLSYDPDTGKFEIKVRVGVGAGLSFTYDEQALPNDSNKNHLDANSYVEGKVVAKTGPLTLGGVKASFESGPISRPTGGDELKVVPTPFQVGKNAGSLSTDVGAKVGAGVELKWPDSFSSMYKFFRR